jgi:hypothetical protein
LIAKLRKKIVVSKVYETGKKRRSTSASATASNQAIYFPLEFVLKFLKPRARMSHPGSDIEVGTPTDLGPV